MDKAADEYQNAIFDRFCKSADTDLILFGSNDRYRVSFYCRTRANEIKMLNHIKSMGFTIDKINYSYDDDSEG